MQKIYLLVILSLCSISWAQNSENTEKPDQPANEVDPFGWVDDLPFETHGFWEMRAGYRLQDDEHQRDMSIMETRLQLDLFRYEEWGELKFKGDLIGDRVLEEADFDIREAYIFTMPFDFMDLWVGRQILTWGTGDLIFINDLFPKDWQSFFIGRDDEYLKAPSDAAKASFFTDWANIDVVYTPQFDSDRYITGDRLSYWSSSLGRIAGQDDTLYVEKPDRWFHDDELAVRIYKYIDRYEVAFYGYRGFWKSPAGQTPTGQARFPDLNVYGASIRGNFAKGIANLEFGYYQSEDQGGTDPLVNNSEIRLLAGYTQELAKNFNIGLQYYIEHMNDYGEYLDSLPSGPARDRDRHLTTIRLTRLLMKQTLELSLFTYYSPTDKDAHMRPKVNYKVTDNLEWELGANIFFGDYKNTFFGQFEDNTNIYTGIRYSF